MFKGKDFLKEVLLSDAPTLTARAKKVNESTCNVTLKCLHTLVRVYVCVCVFASANMCVGVYVSVCILNCLRIGKTKARH